MIQYDASNAQCVVYSFKEGLLSKIAHDLKHRVTRFSLQMDEQTKAIQAEFDAYSLRVECVMKDGKETKEVLSDDDKRKIEEHVVEDVLHAKEHPAIKFQSLSVLEQSAAFYIQGLLEINGRKRPIATLARRMNGHYLAELTVHQPAFDIKPFSAMMGTLKIKPDVIVHMIVPAG